MKQVLFVLGLALCISAFVLYLQGSNRYVQHESENLGSWTSRISPESSKEVVWFNPQSMRYVADNLTLFVSVDASDGELLFHVLNESQFGTWQQSQTLNQIFKSKIVLDELDFSFELEENETYHFVAENPSNTTADTHLYLLLAGDFLRFDYTFMPLYVVLFMAGMTICLILRKEFSSRFDEFLKGWSLPVYRQYGKAEGDAEHVRLRYDSILRIKRLAKYFILALLGAIFIDFLYVAFPVASLMGKWHLVRPEYNLLIIDLLIRNSVLKTFVILPLLVGTPIILIIIYPRLEDLSDLVKSTLGLEKRRTRKQLQISSHMYRNLVTAAFSYRFLLGIAFLTFSFLLILYSPLGKMQIVKAVFLTFSAVGLGIWGGYIIWSGFHEGCREHGIGKYAADRFMKLSIVDCLIEWSLATVFVTILLLFTISDFWTSTVRSIVIEPIALLKPIHMLSDFPTSQFGVFIGIFSIVLAMSLIGLLFFVLFPFFHRMGLRGLAGAFLVFSLTYITEYLVIWILEGTMSVVFQPIAIISPTIAAIVSWIAQDKYKKMMKKRLI